MKQLFTFLFLIALTNSFVQAQTFSDDFENYAAGSFLAQSSTTWATWSSANGGGADDATVSSANAHSGTNSLYLASTAVGGGPDDILLPFGSVLSNGTFSFGSWLYVNAGKTAYFNYQASTTPGQIWSMDVNFDANGDLRFTNSGALLLQTTYPQGQWFEFDMNANLNNSSWEILIDGVSVGTFQNPVFNVASMDFYPVENSAFYMDDVSFDYVPYVTPLLNAAAMNLTVENGLASQTRQPTVDIRNLGTSVITSFDLTVDYNGVQNTQSVTGVSYAAGTVNTVNLTQIITLSAGTLPATVTVSNVNGNATDDDPSDDVAFANVIAVAPASGKVVVAEEATGTWCSWCPRGAVFMDLMSTKYDGFFAGIAVHNNDPMTNVDYDAAIAPFIGGYPSALVDRTPEIDPMELEQSFLERIVVAPAVFLTNGAQYNAATRELKVSINSNWQTAVTGTQYKLACVLTEDSVTGVGSGWAQSNSYAGGSNGVMGGFELLPSPVPASMMHYDHVARYIYPGWNGAAAYAATVNAGDEVIDNFTFTLPADWDETKMHIVGMVIYTNGSNTYIDNASTATIDEAVANGFEVGTDLGGISGIYFDDPSAQLSLYPNPTTDQTFVQLNLQSASHVSVAVFSVDGRLLQEKNYGMLNGGNVLPVLTKSLANGVYVIEVSINGAKHALKCVKQ